MVKRFFEINIFRIFLNKYKILPIGNILNPYENNYSNPNSKYNFFEFYLVIAKIYF